jgi:hypothetical protein
VRHSVDASARLVGVVDRDACMAAHTKGVPCGIRVADVMTRDVATRSAMTSRLKITRQIRRVLVVRDRKLVDDFAQRPASRRSNGARSPTAKGQRRLPTSRVTDRCVRYAAARAAAAARRLGRRSPRRGMPNGLVHGEVTLRGVRFTAICTSPDAALREHAPETVVDRRADGRVAGPRALRGCSPTW